jgi:hypothetical protein
MNSAEKNKKPLKMILIFSFLPIKPEIAALVKPNK